MNTCTPLRQLKTYLLITFGITWTFWGSLAIQQLPMSRMPASILFALGGVGPAAAALYLVFRHEDAATRKDYFFRLLNPKGLGMKWAAVSLLIPLTLLIIAGLVDWMVGGIGIMLDASYSAQPVSLLSLAAFTLFFGPLPEEMGWRGYALDRMQTRLHPINAGLLLGFIWLMWHLPLFFIPGTYQSGLGFSSPGFWLFMVGIVPQSILMAWIYNASNRSTLSAVLYHFSVNFFGTILVISDRATIMLAGVWVLSATIAFLLLNPNRH